MAVCNAVHLHSLLIDLLSKLKGQKIETYTCFKHTPICIRQNTKYVDILPELKYSQQQQQIIPINPILIIIC